MPELIRRAAGLWLTILFLSSGLAIPRAEAWEVVEVRNFREAISACRHGYDPPKVHVLPMGVGKAPVARCFTNGFRTIYPSPKTIGVCYIKVEPERKYATWRDRETQVSKILRRKYSCRFEGAGAVLGQSRGIRKTGTRVYFQGEEPSNFKTKDPGCKAIFDELSKQNDKYIRLIKGR